MFPYDFGHCKPFLLLYNQSVSERINMNQQSTARLRWAWWGMWAALAGSTACVRYLGAPAWCDETLTRWIHFTGYLCLASVPWVAWRGFKALAATLLAFLTGIFLEPALGSVLPRFPDAEILLVNFLGNLAGLLLGLNIAKFNERKVETDVPA